MAHDAVSSYLGSLSLSQNGWHIRRKISVRGLDKASYPVITYAGESMTDGARQVIKVA